MWVLHKGGVGGVEFTTPVVHKADPLNYTQGLKILHGCCEGLL